MKIERKTRCTKNGKKYKKPRKPSGMKGIRIQPNRSLFADEEYLIDVVCICGTNCLMDEVSLETSFKHPVTLGGKKKTLLCMRCKQRYEITPQSNHFHVSSIGKL